MLLSDQLFEDFYFNFFVFFYKSWGFGLNFLMGFFEIFSMKDFSLESFKIRWDYLTF